MSEAFITRTGSYLPGAAVDNAQIDRVLGKVPGQGKVKGAVLKANGIETRHYALDEGQNATHTLYELAAEAVRACLADGIRIDYLSSGTTFAPYIAPGVSSLLHDQLSKEGLVSHAVEINSNSGVCTSGAQAMVNATRAVKTGEAKAAMSVGVEQASVRLKSRAFRTSYDLPAMARNLRGSKWFMAVFLRFMLSDGAGAFLIEPQPRAGQANFKINWTFSRSFANEAPLCMYMETRSQILRQDVSILARNMGTLSKRAVEEALGSHNETLASYTMVLPHMSSYYFERSVQKTLRKLEPEGEVPYWTNLRTAGNTGAASIYIMLDEYLKTKPVAAGDRLLLFIPESGQFNYVIISLTAV
jgi:3-oxoacyl-[acyl-carrier-protein] synthase-3